MWFQSVGPTSHFSRNVRIHRNDNFERGSPVAWPQRSPDLTVLNYYYGDI